MEVDADAAKGDVGCQALSGSWVISLGPASGGNAGPERPLGGVGDRGDKDAVVNGIPEGEPFNRVLVGIGPVIEIGA